MYRDHTKVIQIGDRKIGGKSEANGLRKTSE